MKELGAAVKVLNDSGLIKEKIKIVGQAKETLVNAFVEAVKGIPGGKDGKKCPEAVTQFYNLINPPEEKPVKAEKGGIQKVGIIATIISSIQKKPLTKAQILEILVEKFPDRKADGMKSTISIQLGPTRLATKYDLKKDGDKYRIEG